MGKKLDELKKEIKRVDFIYSHVCSPRIELDDCYIRILRQRMVDIISGNEVFYMSYDELSDKVLDKIISNLKNVK